MASAWNAAILATNLADAGTITCSSAALLTPASRLQNPHIARKWRGISGDTESVVVDLGSVQSIDTVMLRGINLTTAGITRVRTSVADSTGQAGDVYDSGSVTGAVDEDYENFVNLMTTPGSCRYVRIDLNEPSATYVEAGRLAVGLRQQLGINFAFGYTERHVDRSREVEGRGGQTFIDPDNSYRIWNVTFDNVSSTERFGLVETLDRLNGIQTDFLFVRDPTSTNLGRDSLWGRVKTIAPISSPQAWLGDEPAYSKSYEIYERL